MYCTLRQSLTGVLTATPKHYRHKVEIALAMLRILVCRYRHRWCRRIVHSLILRRHDDYFGMTVERRCLPFH